MMMNSKILISSLALLMGLSFVACTKKMKTSAVEAVFEKPLIIGASVSGDHLAPSPGKVISLRYTSPEDVQVMAQKGKPGSEVLAKLDSDTLKDRSIVIGVDLFFWDSLNAQTEHTFQALTTLMAMVEQKNLPIILGDIPVLMPGMQRSASALNKKLKQVCSGYEKCRILPLAEFLADAKLDGSIQHDGERYNLSQLLPDGLHLGVPASEYLADRIFDLVRKM